MAGPGSHSTLSGPAWTPPHPSGYAVCGQENVNPFPKGLKGLPANQRRQRPNPGAWLLSCRTPDLPRHCLPSPDPPLHIGTEAFSTVPIRCCLPQRPLVASPCPWGASTVFKGPGLGVPSLHPCPPGSPLTFPGHSVPYFGGWPKGEAPSPSRGPTQRPPLALSTTPPLLLFTLGKVFFLIFTVIN